MHKMHGIALMLSKVRCCSRRRKLSKLSDQPSPDSQTIDSDADSFRATTVVNRSVSGHKHSTQTSLGRSSQGICFLETLPAEIRRQIIYLPGFADLRSLVHASPVFHQQYVLDRRSILSACLDSMLGGVIVDAYAVHKTIWLRRMFNNRAEPGILALRPYQSQESFSTQRQSLATELTLDQLIDMFTFHSLVLEPLVPIYTEWALANFPQENGDKSHRSRQHQPLSGMEEMRLMRALYRFQLFCNLQGLGRHIERKNFLPFVIASTAADKLNKFFCWFEPWEVEEIICIHTFAMDKLSGIFCEVYVDACLEWDRNVIANDWIGPQRGPDSSECFLAVFNHADKNYANSQSACEHLLLEGVVARGLDMLRRVCCPLVSREDLVSLVRQNFAVHAGFFLENDEDDQQMRHFLHPCERDEKQIRCDPMPFRGDGDFDEQGPRPPLAWTLLWRGKYSNLISSHIPRAVRLWGYVMWDAARLEGTFAASEISKAVGDPGGICYWGPDDDDYT
jgi:hypothetical protein